MGELQNNANVTNGSHVEWHFKDSEPYSLQMEGVWSGLSSLANTSDAIIPVAILDSGLAELVQNSSEYFETLLPGYDFISDPLLALDNDGRDPNPTDPGDAGPDCPVSSWHGTKMASAVGLRHGVVPGVHSMLSGRVAAIQPMRVLGQCSMGYANDVTDAIVWAAGGQINGLPLNLNPVKVISMSFSGQGTCPSFLQSAVNLAISKGVMLVGAAGNQGSNAEGYFPGNCVGVIAIGSSTREGTLAPYSNWARPCWQVPPGVMTLIPY